MILWREHISEKFNLDQVLSNYEKGKTYKTDFNIAAYPGPYVQQFIVLNTIIINYFPIERFVHLYL